MPTKVILFFGSMSDKDKVKPAADCLLDFGVEYKAYALSAHRQPEILKETLAEVEREGAQVIIAAAGLAAHLPGVIASMTTLPVIGIPIEAKLNGLDSLLSIVQMPKSVPVACDGVDNSFNAALLAIQILSLSDSSLKDKITQYRKNLVTQVINGGQVDIN